VSQAVCLFFFRLPISVLRDFEQVVLFLAWPVPSLSQFLPVSSLPIYRAKKLFELLLLAVIMQPQFSQRT